MELSELVHAISRGDLLSARQWVKDARRSRLAWAHVEEPIGLTERELTIAAGLVELLAARDGSSAPTWTRRIGPYSEVVVLDPGLEQMPRSYAHARTDGPEPLRRRNLIALPDFLKVA
jgi:hypothetical protein